MARRLDAFPEQSGGGQRRYPWSDWTDGDIWEIKRGDDYDVATENMRVNLHLKASALARKVKTSKLRDGTGLVFQFLDSEEMEEVRKKMELDKEATTRAINQLYEDAIEIYERARKEVDIERKDGSTQKYAPIRFKRQIEDGQAEGMLVPTVAKIVKKPTLGFGHLAKAGKKDLMLESLVVDPGKPYHGLFSPKTVQVASARLEDYEERRG